MSGGKNSLDGYAVHYGLHSFILMLPSVRVFKPLLAYFYYFFKPGSDQTLDGFGRCAIIIQNVISWRSVVNRCKSMSPKLLFFLLESGLFHKELLPKTLVFCEQLV